jgi:hypothetical protein
VSYPKPFAQFSVGHLRHADAGLADKACIPYRAFILIATKITNDSLRFEKHYKDYLAERCDSNPIRFMGLQAISPLMYCHIPCNLQIMWSWR